MSGGSRRGPTNWPRVAALLLAGCPPAVCQAQDLTPRAYAVTPVASNAVIGTYAFSKGEILFDPALPIDNARGSIHTPVLTYYRAFDFFSRSANFTASLPYAIGNFEGDVGGTDRQIRRAGLMDSVFRLSVNLLGGPAMTVREFVKTPPAATTVGASIRVVAPTGQYVNTRAINPGSNRWAFKPEVGLSQRMGRILVDVYGGVWLFAANDDYFASSEDARGSRRTQEPIAALETHISYDVKPRLWISLDLNYWYGGRTSLNGIESASSLQGNSRIGITGSVPLSRAQSLKFSYSDGAIVRVGGGFRVLSLGWQYGWFGNPFRKP